jgi:hypothetical protein
MKVGFRKLSTSSFAFVVSSTLNASGTWGDAVFFGAQPQVCFGFFLDIALFSSAIEWLFHVQVAWNARFRVDRTISP